MPKAEIRPHNGAPILWIDEAPVFPLLLMSTATGLRELQALGFEGTHLYTVDTPLWWAGIGRYDFSGIDAHVSEFLQVDPHALLIPRITLEPPVEWLDAHPDELLRGAIPAEDSRDPGNAGSRHPSWASELWQRDAVEALRALLNHTAEQTWRHAIIGWHVGAGLYAEWHYHASAQYPDRSPPFLQAYEKWLRLRYPAGNIDPTPPDPSERQRGDWAGVLDPSRRRNAIDYFTFFHELGANVLGRFARVVKSATQGQALVLAFNGYLPDLGQNHEIDHRAFDRALANPDLDAFASPHTYWRRAPGDDAIMRGFPASVRLHGKMFWDEQDDRTIRASPVRQKRYTHVRDMTQSVEILWRGFAQALTQAQGLWFMDQGSMWYPNDPDPGYYRDSAIVTAFEQMRRIAEDSLKRSRNRSVEVAVIGDLHSAFHLVDSDWTKDHIGTRLYHQTMGELSRCGLPFDMYLLTDLEHMPTYKAYVFLDAVYLTDGQIARLKELRARGAHLGFLVAAGMASPAGLSLDRMRDLLQMPLRFSTEPPPHPSLPPALHDTRNGIAESERTWYAPQPPVSAGTLRSLLQQSGAHVYAEHDDNLMVGSGYLALHAASTGLKTLRLPKPATWTDLRNGTVVARNAERIVIHANLGQTLLFAFSEAGQSS